MAEHVLVKAPPSSPLKLLPTNLNRLQVKTQNKYGSLPHKWERVWNFPSSGELRHLTGAVSSYIQTWTSDHSDWKEVMLLLIFRTPQYINSNINDKNTCIYRVFQTNVVEPHASSSEWVSDWLEICSEVNCPHLDLLAETFPTVTTAELVIVARCLLVLKQSLNKVSVSVTACSLSTPLSLP